MSRYTPDSKDRVRDAVDMISLVSSKTELRRAGVNSYFGRCPFHDERTGSFHVRPEEKHYHCFGCQESGDPFDFVMQTEGLDFRGALESLAGRFGVTLEVEDEDPMARARRERRDRLHALLDRAAGYYARFLWESAEAGPARDYLARRGLVEATLRTYRVGYAPSAWDKTLLGSRQAGFTEEELLATGLAQRGRQRGGLYDRFRGRIMFPLSNARGKVVGFGARAMRDNQRPKYLNTSEGEVFHKGSQLFGIDIARRAAARAGTIVLAEGYTDVLALHQAGIENAAGVMGTSFTDEQARELERTARTLVLALDADSAGQEAVLRAARIAAGRRLELRVVTLPEGSDPADLILAEGPDAIRERVARSIPFVSFHVDRIIERSDLSHAEGKDRAIAELRPVLAPLAPSVLREELVARVAKRLELSAQLAATLLDQPAGGAPEGAEAGALGPAGAGGAGGAFGPAGAGGAPGAFGGAPAGAFADDAFGPEPPAWIDEDPGYPGGDWDEDPGPEPPPSALSAPRRPLLIDRRDKNDQTFLALCVALPREGTETLARLNPADHLTSDLARRAAAHLAPRLATPLEDLPADDRELAAYVTELSARAARGNATAASLEHAFLLLELTRLDRAIEAARVAGTGGIGRLSAEREPVRIAIGRLSEQLQSD